MASNTSDTVPALFRFTLPSTDPTSPTNIDTTHPVPTFLTSPTPSQRTSPAFHTAFLDVITLITHLHHASCMSQILTPCPSCSKPATDLLKNPTSYLHLAEPMVVIRCTPVCGSKGCEERVRAGLLKKQKEEMEEGGRAMERLFGGMKCQGCGKEGKRCAGCGTVAYCGVECQKAGWKAHKRFCGRKKIGQDLSGAGGPFEMI